MFRDKRISNKMALKLYMHVDVDVCLLRRIKRDIRARGRSIEKHLYPIPGNRKAHV